MKKSLKKIYDSIVNALIILVILLVLLLVGVRLFGLTPFTVLSGSMEPTYHVGSIVYVRKVPASDLQLHDPITFRLNRTVVTHRIIEVVEDPQYGRCFRTQGDANNVADGGVVTPAEVVGKPVFSIPLLGYLSNMIQTPPGIYVAIGGCVILILLSFISELIFGKTESSSKEE